MHTQMPATPASVQELLKNLLSIRQSYKKTANGHVVYSLPSISCSDGTALENAFDDIGRRGKKAKKTADLRSKARQAYLSHLTSQIENDSKAQNSLELERQYIALQNYLAAASFQKTEDVSAKILEICKQYCRQVIDYFTYTLEPESVPTPPALQLYSDDLLGSLIYGQMSGALNNFQDVIQLVSNFNVCHFAAKMWRSMRE